MDPFALTCDPRAYVPRPASEAALVALEDALLGGRVCALTGPPGIGKTLLLRVLEVRLAGRVRCVYVPYGALETADLCRLVLGLMSRSVPAAADPERCLADVARLEAGAGRPLVLLLDDAHAIPLAAMRRLVALAGALGGALRLLAVPVDHARSARALAALGRGVAHVRFVTAMSDEETERYVAARLARAGAPPEALARLTPHAVRWLHRESGGNPRSLHQLAGWMLHRDGPVPDATAALGDSGPAIELDPA